jgi:hypothetical protein
MCVHCELRALGTRGENAGLLFMTLNQLLGKYFLVFSATECNVQIRHFSRQIC